MYETFKLMILYSNDYSKVQITNLFREHWKQYAQDDIHWIAEAEINIYEVWTCNLVDYDLFYLISNPKSKVTRSLFWKTPNLREKNHISPISMLNKISKLNKKIIVASRVNLLHHSFDWIMRVSIAYEKVFFFKISVLVLQQYQLLLFDCQVSHVL